MELTFKDEAIKDLEFFSRNKAILKRIENLLASMKQTPFTGIGKPEPLKYELSGYWSRRITDDHRIVYKVENDLIVIYSLRGHY
ncbi:MAG: Txe/YoeB family addiction module toxin [Bacteroidales bacterium]|nr:Txe/YoeB family addiction module toxin [Bacteroidales bacterium]